MKKLVQFELRKIFARRLTWGMLAGVLALSAILTISTFQNKYAFNGVHEGNGKAAVDIDKQIAARYAGSLNDEKVKQMLSELVPQSAGINAVYLYRNAMQSAVAARFSDPAGQWNGLSVADVFGGEAIQIGYVDGWLSTSQNLIRVTFALAFVIILMIAPVFCGEYGGVDSILLSSRYGKTKCAGAKVIAGLTAALLTGALVYGFNLGAAWLLYGSEGLDCSILFAPLIYIEGGIPLNLSCGALLAYQTLLALTGVLGAAGITLVFSAACKNGMSAAAASAAFYVFPILLPLSETAPAFRLAALLPVYHAQFTALMSLGPSDGGMLHALWALPAALILFSVGAWAACRIFARHPVS